MLANEQIQELDKVNYYTTMKKHYDIALEYYEKYREHYNYYMNCRERIFLFKKNILGEFENGNE